MNRPNKIGSSACVVISGDLVGPSAAAASPTALLDAAGGAGPLPRRPAYCKGSAAPDLFDLRAEFAEHVTATLTIQTRQLGRLMDHPDLAT